MSNVILCNISDANNIIKEERENWIYNVLVMLNVTEEILDSVPNVDKYRYHMYELGIEVELQSNGNIDIYKKQPYMDQAGEITDWLPPTKDHLVAQWKEPTRVKKVEGKNVYYEIHLNEWSILNMRHK